MIFDSHCHYNLPPLTEHWRSHWKKARDMGVSGAIVVGTEYESSRTAVAIADDQPGLFASVGTHPENYHALAKSWLESSWNDEGDFDGVIKNDIEQARTLISESVAAIGEVGLDYFHLPAEGKERSLSIALQQEAFAAHIQLAAESSLPLIVHVRDSKQDAYLDALDLLTPHLAANNTVILHCISGPIDYLQKATVLGAYVGVAANSTYPNASHIRALVALVPKKQLLLETDAPFLPPQSHRGSTCEPWMITESARFLEESLSIHLEQCFENTLRCFNLELPNSSTA